MRHKRQRLTGSSLRARSRTRATASNPSRPFLRHCYWNAEGLVSHAGAFLLTEIADRTGLTEAFQVAMAPTRERRSAHDPGRVLRDLAVSIADGGDCVSDLGVLHGQGVLFGKVASETTAHRIGW